MPSPNKINFNGQTLIDLTNDTVTPETLQSGVMAHDASGASIVGVSDVPSMIAYPFSESVAYNIGDYVTYNGALYCFTSSHSIGAWNNSEVLKVTVAEELDKKSDIGHIHDDRYLQLSGGTMTGTLTINGNNLYLRTIGSSSDDSGDIGWFYGTGQEKMRIWAENEYTEKSGPRFRMYKKDGTALFSGSLSLSDHTHDDRYYTESEMNTKLNAKENTLTYQEINIASLVSSGVSCTSAYIIKYGAMAVIRVNGLKRSSSDSGWTEFFNLSTYLKPSVVYQGVIANDSKSVDGGYIAAECQLNTDGKFRIYAPIANTKYWGSLVVINK